jgi:hypothetical protein
MRDSDVTGAAVQVRLEGHLFAELENWRRAQPKIIPRSWALRQLLERLPPIDALARQWPVSPDNDNSRKKTAPRERGRIEGSLLHVLHTCFLD